jgi:iron transport multicopper oxidase
MTYKFTLDAPGTFWYHSHSKGQYPDGLRAPIIVHDDSLPWEYTDEYILTLSDWYHKQGPEILSAFQSPFQGPAPPVTPVPNSIIMNDGIFSSYKMIPGQTYLLHILNIGAFPSFFVNFANVGFSVIGIDGMTTQNTSTPANTLYVGAAQRYRVLVVAPENPTTQGAFTAVVDQKMFDPPFGIYNGPPAIFGTFDYGLSEPSAVYNTSITAGTFPTSMMPPANDLTFKPLATVPLYGPVTRQFVINFSSGLVEGIPRALINNKTYLPQNVPSLYTALTAPQELRNNSAIYGQINPFVVNYNNVVEIVINNLTPTGHPWHLHGHEFQVVARGGANTTYDPATADPNPMMRDVAGVEGDGFVVFRFMATNPGIQLSKLPSGSSYTKDTNLTPIFQSTVILNGTSRPALLLQSSKLRTTCAICRSQLTTSPTATLVAISPLAMPVAVPTTGLTRQTSSQMCRKGAMALSTAAQARNCGEEVW